MLGVDKVPLIYNESTVPAIPANAAKIKYSVPMSLWLVEKNQLTIKWYVLLRFMVGLSNDEGF